MYVCVYVYIYIFIHPTSENAEHGTHTRPGQTIAMSEPRDDYLQGIDASGHPKLLVPTHAGKHEGESLTTEVWG